MKEQTKNILIKFLNISLILFLVALSASWAYFRYYKETTFRVSEPLSKSMVVYVDKAMDDIGIINGVQVVKVDLRKNVRFLVHTYWKDPGLNALYANFRSTSITVEVPVFSKDDAQNARIIRLMNHEYECIPFTETLSYNLVPAAAKYVTTICSISIPPAFNEFKGILVVSLSRVPTEDEKSMIRSMLIDVSSKVHTEIK